VTFKITKCDSAQNIIMDSIKRLKHRIASCTIGYDAMLEMQYIAIHSLCVENGLSPFHCDLINN